MSGDSLFLVSPTIGRAWIDITARIMAYGSDGEYEGRAMRELVMVTLKITHPAPVDGEITQWADPERLAWMHVNFTDPASVPELGGSDSYATRLMNLGPF